MIRYSVQEVPGVPVCELGEGPLWDSRIASLLWVDVPAGLIHRYEPAAAYGETLELDRVVSFVVPRASGGYAIGLNDGVYGLNADGSYSLLASIPPHAPTTRLNDGKCDPYGNLWCGGLSQESVFGLESLYRLGSGLELSRELEGVTISNGLAWSSDATTMYYVDTPTSRIDAFSFSGDGSISDRRCVVEIPYTAGFPDGMCIDAEDCLWVALFGGNAVHRYSPSGELLAVLDVPVRDVTSCAFGGEDLSTLYITTAAWGGPGTTKNEDPAAGRTYQVRPGVAGAPVGVFAG